MPDDFKWLKLNQLDQQAQQWRKAAEEAPRPKGGWLRALRTALGMTTGQLAGRLGTSQPWINQLEKGEVQGTASVASLQRAAEALGCDLVYALVPRKPLEEMLRQQAEAVAKQELMTVGHSMALEQQRPSREVEAAQLKRLRDKLLDGPWRRLWK
jgi:predicted DNA-binding mobile mystery protein A